MRRSRAQRWVGALVLLWIAVSLVALLRLVFGWIPLE